MASRFSASASPRSLSGGLRGLQAPGSGMLRPVFCKDVNAGSMGWRRGFGSVKRAKRRGCRTHFSSTDWASPSRVLSMAKDLFREAEKFWAMVLVTMSHQPKEFWSFLRLSVTIRHIAEPRRGEEVVLVMILRINDSTYQRFNESKI